MFKIDLHLHSTYSDGKLTPKQLVEEAYKRKIPAISITDHDNAEANKEAAKYAKERGIEYVSGIEFTITPPEGAKEFHMVGLFIDPKNKEIKKIPAKRKKDSIKKLKQIIKKLNKLGYKITFEEVSNETEGKHFGRPLIAKVLMRKYPQEFPERKIVFDKLLGKEGKAFVKAKGENLKKAIEITHNAGGIALVAHPWYLGRNMIKVLDEFVSLGGDGVEMHVPNKEKIPKNTKKILKKFVRKNNLIISAGTDFHEFDGKNDMGEQGLSKKEFKRLKKYAIQRKN